MLSAAGKMRKCKKVDIKFSAHDAFLKYPSSGTLKDKIFEGQIYYHSN